jgi:Zn-dependent protease with chaperone function
VKWGKTPEQKLVIDGVLERSSLDKVTAKPIYDQPKKSYFWMWLFAFIMLLTGSGVGFYFYGLNAIADRMAEALPREWEISVGKTLLSSVVDPSLIDEKRSFYLTNYITHADLDNTRGYELDVTVVNSPEMNAFALPGGHIIVYSAILDSLKEPEQLAALLAHEWIHIRNQHTTKMVLRSMGAYLVISQFFSNLSGLATVFLEEGENLYRLSYSRDVELEADVDALIFLNRNEISDEGFYSLLAILQKQERTGGMPSFLKTHPELEERMAVAKNSSLNDHGFSTPPSLLFAFKSSRK